VRRGALLGGLAVAASGAAPLRALAQGAGDAPILARLTRIERAAEFAYATAYRRGRLGSKLHGVARQFRDQHREHADGLSAELSALGVRPPARPTEVSEVTGLARALAGGPRAFLALGVSLEEEAVRAGYAAVRELADAKLIQSAASIMGNDGQHLVVLRQALGRDPIPHALETGIAS
jgi:hypothetical protein